MHPQCPTCQVHGARDQSHRARADSGRSVTSSGLNHRATPGRPHTRRTERHKVTTWNRALGSVGRSALRTHGPNEYSGGSLVRRMVDQKRALSSRVRSNRGDISRLGSSIIRKRCVPRPQRDRRHLGGDNTGLDCALGSKEVREKAIREREKIEVRTYVSD